MKYDSYDMNHGLLMIMKIEPLKQQELVDYRDNPVFAFIIGAVIEARHESLNTEMVM